MLEKLVNRQWDEVRASLMEMHPSEAAEAVKAVCPPAKERLRTGFCPRRPPLVYLGILICGRNRALSRSSGEREVAAILNEMSPDDRTAFLEKPRPHPKRNA